eukprot:g1416.t1
MPVLKDWKEELSSERKGFAFFHNVSRPLLSGMDVTRLVMAMPLPFVRGIFNRYRDMINPKMEAHLFALTFEQFRFLFKLASIDELNAAGIATLPTQYLSEGSAEAQLNIIAREGDDDKHLRAMEQKKMKVARTKAVALGAFVQAGTKHAHDRADADAAKQQQKQAKSARHAAAKLRRRHGHRGSVHEHDAAGRGAEPWEPPPLAEVEALFKHMSKANHRIDCWELFGLLAMLCRAPVDDKAGLLFDMFDIGGQGEMREDGAVLVSMSLLRGLSRLHLCDEPEQEVVEYSVMHAFVDAQRGTTLAAMTRKRFQNWLTTDPLALAVLEVLACVPRVSVLVRRMERAVTVLQRRLRVGSAGDGAAAQESGEEAAATPAAPDIVTRRLEAERVARVRLLLGPVLGRVSSGSVVLLFELSEHADIRVKLKPICRTVAAGHGQASGAKHKSSRHAAEIARMLRLHGKASAAAGAFVAEASATPGKPLAVTLDRLPPATEFELELEGVRVADADDAAARFKCRTFAEHRRCQACGKLYHLWPRHDPIEFGENRRRVQRATEAVFRTDKPTGDAAAHAEDERALGDDWHNAILVGEIFVRDTTKGTVESKAIGDEVKAQFVGVIEEMTGMVDGEDAAIEITSVRNTDNMYRLAWRLPRTRDVMACTPNLTFSAAAAPARGARQRRDAGMQVELALIKDQLALYAGQARTEEAGQRELELLAHIAARVRRRYEGQLWGAFSSDEDEAKGSDTKHGDTARGRIHRRARRRREREREQEKRFLRFGSVGLLCIEPHDPAFASTESSSDDADDDDDNADDKARDEFKTEGALGEAKTAGKQSSDAEVNSMIPEQQWRFIEQCLSSRDLKSGEGGDMGSGREAMRASVEQADKKHEELKKQMAGDEHRELSRDERKKFSKVALDERARNTKRVSGELEQAAASAANTRARVEVAEARLRQPKNCSRVLPTEEETAWIQGR